MEQLLGVEKLELYHWLIVVSSIGAVVMAFIAMAIRMKAAKKPASAKKIILPPIFMSTGALMYVVPAFRLTLSEMGEAVVIGVFFSFFLIKTSQFEIRDQHIYLKRSKAFFFILFGLIVIRLLMKTYLTLSIPYGQISGMFFLLAFSMILPWRVAMYFSYRKLEAELKNRPPVLT